MKHLVTSHPQSRTGRNRHMHGCYCSAHFLFYMTVQDLDLGNGATQFRLGLPTSVTIKTVSHRHPTGQPALADRSSLRLSSQMTQDYVTLMIKTNHPSGSIFTAGYHHQESSLPSDTVKLWHFIFLIWIIKKENISDFLVFL